MEDEAEDGVWAYSWKRLAASLEDEAVSSSKPQDLSIGVGPSEKVDTALASKPIISAMLSFQRTHLCP